MEEVMSGSGTEAEQQIKQQKRSDCGPRREQHKALRLDSSPADQQPVRIHGLSVDRYREVYNSVLQPSVLATLSSSKHADYVSQVLELKQCLWTKLSQPQLQETLMEDGRVEVKEIFDLT